MEISRILLLASVGLFLCATAASAEQPGVITNADNGKEISIPMGGTLDVRLKQPGATGYTWEIVAMDKALLKVLSSGTRPLTHDRRLGGPVERYWQIEALSEGRTELKFALYRHWEGPEKAAERFEVRILIH